MFVKLQYKHVVALLSLLESEKQANLDSPDEFDPLTADEESAYATLLLMRGAMEDAKRSAESKLSARVR